MLDLEDKAFVVCGQALTGRLEVLEDYFSGRYKDVLIIGLANIFAKYDSSRFTVYENGAKAGQVKLFNLLVKKGNFLKGAVTLSAYIIYCLVSFFCVLSARFKKGNLIFIGIGGFPAFLGVLFKRLLLVSRVIYYAIDYFPPTGGAVKSRILVGIDKFCVKQSDYVWEISPRIKEARLKFSGFLGEASKHILVPLTFSEKLLQNRPVAQVERYSIVFVGTSGYFHGLHLLLEAVPQLTSLMPELKIKIIGPGPWDDIRQDISRNGLERHFDFAGFIKDEHALFDIVSCCALGLALYIPVEDNPALYADPGKPKLYAFCAVPVVISKVPFVASQIEDAGAGKAIEFTVSSLVSAVKEILLDDKKWADYRQNAFSFAKRYTSEHIFAQAMKDF